jgi:NAD(P)-dependent dehydrogenase (short-subunit alcohol dehydrogenase family)
MSRLAGRVAAITGGGAGIGVEYARALLGEGVDVALIDRDGDLVAETARELDAGEGRVLAVAADVTDADAVDSAAASVEKEFGKLDILINNAGLHLPEWNKQPTLLDNDRWRRLLDVNVVGIVNVTRAFRPLLSASPAAVVVNQGSMAGHRPTSSYGISKLAVRGLTVALATELAPDGIRVVSLAPAAVASEAVLSNIPKDRLDALVGQQLVPRLAEMSDLVGPLLFLCSDESAFITGETICPSGGYALQV